MFLVLTLFWRFTDRRFRLRVGQPGPAPARILEIVQEMAS